MLNAAQLAVEPPLLVHEKFKNKLRMTPRGRNYYSRDDEKISPIMTQMNFSLGVEREERVQKIIEEHFMTEFFTLLWKAALEGRQLSVPQVMEMQGEKAALMMPTVGRMKTECLQPVIDAVDMIETEAGRMPDTPDLLMDFAGAEIHVEYLGTLAMAQQRLLKTQGIYQGMEALSGIIKLHPESMDIIDFDETTKEVLHVTGWPAKAIRTQDEIDKLRKDRAAAMAQEKKEKLMEKAAQYAPGLMKSPEEGSPIKNLMTAAGGGGEAPAG
jgi:hypothetical protein